MAKVKGSYDRRRVEELLRAVNALDLDRCRGEVAMLVESPAPGRHAAREAVEVIPGKGFAGDYARKSFYKGKLVPGREVSAMSSEVLRVLGVDPLVVGDNLITAGLDLAALEPGEQVQAGAVRLVRSPRPHRPCTVFRERTSPEAFAVVSQDRHRGTLFTVEQGGTLHAGETLRRVSGAE